MEQEQVTMRVAGVDDRAMPRRIKFTVEAINRLKCPAGKIQTWIYDTHTPALALFMGQGGSKTFYVYRKVKGRPQRVKLGRFGDISIEQARKLAQRTTAAIAEGIDPMAEKRRQRAGETLGTLFTYYMETHARVHKKSWQQDQWRFGRYLKRWSNRKLVEIERRDIQALHAKVGREQGPYAANRLLSMLRKMFNVARNVGHESNPAIGVQRFREQSRDRFLGADELPKFFESLEQEPNPTIRDYVMVALLTGARRRNVMSMRWRDVNLEGALWTIPASQSKNAQAMTVPLVELVLDILRRRQGGDSPFVFASYGKSGHLEDIKAAWQKILRRAGIADLRLHDLRRTFGSWQAATGASLPVIGKSLGHKNMASTAVYARLNLDPVRQSVNTAAAAMLATGKSDAGAAS